MQKRRKALDRAAAPPTSEGKRTLDYLCKAVPETTAAALWPCIVARTDQIYETVEDLLDVFKDIMTMLVEEAGLNASTDLQLAPVLKDPVRLHEEALDDYIHDFNDWDDNTVIPETCVIDLLRGRAVCPEGVRMLSLMDKMKVGFEREVRGKTAKLSLLRCKNKMWARRTRRAFATCSPTSFSSTTE
jgi:hypothetical protein